MLPGKCPKCGGINFLSKPVTPKGPMGDDAAPVDFIECAKLDCKTFIGVVRSSDNARLTRIEQALGSIANRLGV